MAFFTEKVCFFIFGLMSFFAFSQSGTYELKHKNGSYCYISFTKKGNEASADIFAWWNTKSGQTGSYFGKSSSSGTRYILKSQENDPDCKVTLILQNGRIQAQFDQCATDHLTEDFNGIYTKITDATSGDYLVAAPKSYFYKKPDAGSRQKTYLIKGNKVTLNIDSITPGNWADVYYVDPNGKEFRGYLKLNELRKINAE